MHARWWILILSVLGCSGVDHRLANQDTGPGAAGVSGASAASSNGQNVEKMGVAAHSPADAGRAGMEPQGQRSAMTAADAGSSAAVGGAVAARAGQGGAAGQQLTAAGVGAGAGTGGAGAANTGVLPAVTDLDKPGPFKSMVVNGTGPNDGYRLDRPEPLAADGLRHPIVVFAAGGGFPENYETLLRYVASHGFVVLTYAATSDDGKGVIDGIDWLIEQSEAASGMLAGKIDTQHIAAAGHSFGALAVFNAAPDPRITTTIHLQGGTLDPHKEVEKLRVPAQFICGETPTGNQDGTFTGDMANPNCAIDFERATTPVFYGSLKGAAHIQLTESVPSPEDALRSQMLGAIGGWLRWWLADDQTQRARYVGADCELCQPDTGWTIKQKGLM